MKVAQPPDPWQEITTMAGHPADEVISALQKSIRRGLLENAVLLALDMYETSEELEEKLWARLTVISVEDVGFGRPDAPVIVETLYRQHLRFVRPEHDRFLFAVHAIRLLATSEKERTSDDLANWARHGTALGAVRAVIPDVALDMHTRAGQAKGRDYRFFMEEASKVIPEKPDRDTRWRRWILEQLDEGKLT